MQITDKDIQMFRERAKTELQSNGAVGRLAWDSVVDALCNEVEELRKNAAPGNAAAAREALVAVKDSVYTGAYGNCFAIVNINLCGYSFAINADQSSFRPHIKVMDQKEVLNRVVDELVDCINKGAAARAALAAPPKKGGAE